MRELADGGTWNTIAGQPTDDSEMALLLARMLTEHGTYSSSEALEAYQFWLASDPFDCGMTIATGLRRRPNPDSQANGAMMRISPLGIFGANHPLETVGEWARLDAALTHPNPVCLQANALFAMAIAHAIKTRAESQSLYQDIADWAEDLEVEPALMEAIQRAAEAPTADYVQQQGWGSRSTMPCGNCSMPRASRRVLSIRSCGVGTPTPTRPFARRSWALCTAWTPYPPDGSTGC